MNEAKITVRKGQVTQKMSREAFRERYLTRFYDPAFKVEREAIDRLEAIAWDAYLDSRKSPITRAAGPGFADPSYEASVEWLAAKATLERAANVQADPQTRSRVLVICGSSRNDFTCPGEMSKTFRLTSIVQEQLLRDGCEADLLDLSLISSQHDRNIHPCKGCASTAMPLCHWPCSCYPNHSLGKVNDWMNEIYARWVACHGVIIVTPVYWYQAPSALKLMIDRLVCADGGNPDVTSTSGKNPEQAKQLELAGWDYPKHLADRVYGLAVHGDVAGIDGVRRALSDWLDWMGLIDAGEQAKLDRYIGYYEPYATSHAALDRDTAVQEEVRNVARAVARAVAAQRAGTLKRPDAGLRGPRPK